MRKLETAAVNLASTIHITSTTYLPITGGHRACAVCRTSSAVYRSPSSMLSAVMQAPRYRHRSAVMQAPRYRHRSAGQHELEMGTAGFCATRISTRTPRHTSPVRAAVAKRPGVLAPSGTVPTFSRSIRPCYAPGMIKSVYFRWTRWDSGVRVSGRTVSTSVCGPAFTGIVTPTRQ